MMMFKKMKKKSIKKYLKNILDDERRKNRN